MSKALRSCFFSPGEASGIEDRTNDASQPGADARFSRTQKRSGPGKPSSLKKSCKAQHRLGRGTFLSLSLGSGERREEPGALAKGAGSFEAFCVLEVCPVCPVRCLGKGLLMAAAGDADRRCLVFTYRSAVCEELGKGKRIGRSRHTEKPFRYDLGSPPRAVFFMWRYLFLTQINASGPYQSTAMESPLRGVSNAHIIKTGQNPPSFTRTRALTSPRSIGVCAIWDCIT